MDDRKGDFSADLSDLKEGLDVGNIVAMLKQEKRAARGTPPLATQTVPRPPRIATVAPAKVREKASSMRGGLLNVTTRLTSETTEVLRRAALQQQLKRQSPSTRQDIIEEAVREWAKRRGYLRDKDPSDLASEHTPAAEQDA